MKKINYLLLAIGSVFILALGSCTDPCDDVTCLNAGTCDDGDCTCATSYYGETCAEYCVSGTWASGVCTCDAGYEGESCDVEERTKFVGSWSYTTACAPGNSYTSMISTASDNVQRVMITNLTGFNDNTGYGVVSGSTIEIPTQTVVDEDGDSWTLSAPAATINDAGTSFDLIVEGTIGGSTVTCTLAYRM